MLLLLEVPAAADECLGSAGARLLRPLPLGLAWACFQCWAAGCTKGKGKAMCWSHCAQLARTSAGGSCRRWQQGVAI